MIEKFEKLGQTIEKRWLVTDYDESVFPDIAAECLADSDVIKTDHWSIAEWVIKSGELPEQQDIAGRFGDPPITLFNEENFYIDVYFWLEGTTSIHQHGFCGAFQVLSGGSIHSVFEFEETETISVSAKTGILGLQKCELLSKSDIQKILPGKQYIHSLFHLDQPSVTIVVRTKRGTEHLPQYSYYRPGLAFDPFYEQTENTKVTHMISAAKRAGYQNTMELLRSYFASAELHDAFKTLLFLRPELNRETLRFMLLKQEKSDFEQALEYFSEAFPGQKDLVTDVFLELDRQDALINLRRIVREREHRFFLALLLNLENREQIFGIIKTEFPDADPKEKCLDWVYDLGTMKLIESEVQNGLDMAGFCDLDIAVFEEMIGGRSVQEIISLLNPIAEKGLSAKIFESCKKLEQSKILGPLLKR